MRAVSRTILLLLLLYIYTQTNIYIYIQTNIYIIYINDYPPVIKYDNGTSPINGNLLMGE